MTKALRLVLASLGFMLSFAAVAQGIVVALDQLGVPRGKVFLDQSVFLDNKLRRASKADGETTLFLADSLSMGGHGIDDTIGKRASRILERRLGAGSARIDDLAFPGIDVFAFYHLSERIAEAKPKAVILQVSPYWFSDFWQKPFRSQLAGWLPVSRWVEALTLPLHVVGLTADRLVLYRSIVALGLNGSWRELQSEQVRARNAYWDIAARAQRSLGFARGLRYRKLQKLREADRSIDESGRVSAEGVEYMLQRALGGIAQDDPTLAVLDAFLARLEGAGIDILIYVPPLNVEHLRDIELYDETGLRQTLSRIEEVVAAHGGQFLDLHELFPDAMFRDHMSHLTFTGIDSGMRRLSLAIADTFEQPRQRAKHRPMNRRR